MKNAFEQLLEKPLPELNFPASAGAGNVGVSKQENVRLMCNNMKI